jgi:methylenetetrahydrofolate dehydrogenase (NADP+)/methenyltetrahydrofolate cyclohydrolase
MNSAKILNGKEIAAGIQRELALEVEVLRARGIQPGLAVILAGDDPASALYVRNKQRMCETLGIRSEKITPPPDVTTDEMLAIVTGLNARDDVDGILVQVPLFKQVDTKRVLMAVDPTKDVDGFHPVNVGNLVTQRPGLVSCTPVGIIEILKRSDIPIAGARAVVGGRSDIVGKPMALLLLHENATVTIAHSRTRDLPAVAREADILVAAIGRPEMITAECIKPGATVIDVGSTRVEGKWLGDVHFASAVEVAGAITPVPGGVGPLTIVMLMSNTVKACKLRRSC